MPLLDHFRGTISDLWPWDALHSAWANALVNRLNHGWLPPNYRALPTTKLGGQIEIDVPTVRGSNGPPAVGAGVYGSTWALPRPAATGVIDFTSLDVFEVQVFFGQTGSRLVGAIELVSPANKDRASHRQAFVSKCAGFLNKGVGVVIVDIVTDRSANLHGELMALFPHIAAPATAAGLLYSASYRTAGSGDTTHLEVWPNELVIGQALPTVPLWIAPEDCVALDLEVAYTDARHNLLIPDHIA